MCDAAFCDHARLVALLFFQWDTNATAKSYFVVARFVIALFQIPGVLLSVSVHGRDKATKLRNSSIEKVLAALLVAYLVGAIFPSRPRILFELVTVRANPDVSISMPIFTPK